MNIQKEMQEEKKWRWFVDNYYGKALDEVNEEMFKKYGGRLRCFFKGKEQSREITNKLSKWFKERNR